MKLTDREGQVAELISLGLTNAAIGKRLGITEGTVRQHLKNIYDKLGLRNRTKLAVAYKFSKGAPDGRKDTN